MIRYHKFVNGCIGKKSIKTHVISNVISNCELCMVLYRKEHYQSKELHRVVILFASIKRTNFERSIISNTPSNCKLRMVLHCKENARAEEGGVFGALSLIFRRHFSREAIRIYASRDSFFIQTASRSPSRYATHIETFWRRNATYKSRFR